MPWTCPDSGVEITDGNRWTPASKACPYVNVITRPGPGHENKGPTGRKRRPATTLARAWADMASKYRPRTKRT